MANSKSPHFLSFSDCKFRPKYPSIHEPAFLAAWRMACGSAGVVTFLIPKGTYLVGPVQFSGPCKRLFEGINRPVKIWFWCRLD
ncbi:unnamed protein product [Citrullus colocynthis]|uniref:Polygalacturonase n=1 Tax=Citrullus colocynthis TaxID=252529 RepID=A0ABP0XL62_9ROSI